MVLNLFQTCYNGLSSQDIHIRFGESFSVIAVCDSWVIRALPRFERKHVFNLLCVENDLSVLHAELGGGGGEQYNFSKQK